MAGTASSYRDGGGALQDRSVTTVTGLDIARTIDVDELDNPIYQRTNLATYFASGIGAPAYATPQDIIGIRGSATKIVRLINLRIQIHTTGAALHLFYYLKRSTANTGGSLTNPAGISLDSSNAAATAVIDLYTAAPTPGTSLGNLSNQYLTSTVPTSVPGVAQWSNSGGLLNQYNTVAFFQPVTLRGVAQAFYVNYAGAALPAGFAMAWDLVWTEAAV